MRVCRSNRKASQSICGLLPQPALHPNVSPFFCVCFFPFLPLIFRPHPSFLAGSPPLFGTRSITDSLVSRDGGSTPTSYYHSHKTSDTVRARLESERRRLNVATPGQKRQEKTKAYGGTGGGGGGSGGIASAADNSTKPDMADLDQLTPELTELVSSLQAERVCASV